MPFGFYSIKFISMRFYQILLIIFLGCGTSKSKVSNVVQSVEVNLIDTIGIGALITQEAQGKRDSLQIKDTMEYARFMLKQFAYCNCLYEALKDDTFFRKIDRSNALLARDLVIHPPGVKDSVSNKVRNYVAWVNRTSNPTGAKNYSLFCLELYESKYLDSLVKSYDSKVIK